MNIEINNIEIEIDESIFVFKNGGVEAFLDIEDFKRAGDSRKLIGFLKENILECRNVFVNGKEITADELKQINLPTGLCFALLNKIHNSLTDEIMAATNKILKKSEKNEESSSGSSGASASLN